VLIYDASSAKVSKASTFRLNESYGVRHTQPFRSQLKNGNNYNNLTTSGLTTYYAPSNALSTLAAGTIAVGSRGGDYNLDTSLPHSKLGKSNLRIFDGTNMHTLDAPAIKAAANLATVSTTTPAPENKMVVYNPATSNYAYHDVPAGVTLPSLHQTHSILMRGVNASFAKKGSRLCQLTLERNRSSSYGWGHFSHITQSHVSGTGITFHPRVQTTSTTNSHHK
jgi:hypothetical protein